MEVIITRTQKRAMALMVLCTIFTSGGQILWKMGVNQITFSDIMTYFNLPFLLGFVSYGLGAVLMLIAFRRGELSVLYPIVATSYIWVSVISPRLFPDDFMNAWKWAGVIIILISVSILGWASSRKKKKRCPVVNMVAVLLVVIGSWAGSYGTFILKKGANLHTFWQIFRTQYFWWGVFLNGISIPFYVVALRLEQLSFIYPLVSINYIWTTWFSVKYLGEKMDGWKYLALIGVIVGIVLIGIGS